MPLEEGLDVERQMGAVEELAEAVFGEDNGDLPETPYAL
jgi:hypothetical protein